MYYYVVSKNKKKRCEMLDGLKDKKNQKFNCLKKLI